MIAVFVYTDWALLYPQFAATVNAAQAQSCFNQAQLYCANIDTAVIPYDTTTTPPITTRLDILYLLTAHVAQLQYGSTLGPATGMVGRISAAEQGSVSVNAEMKGPDSAAWFNQTTFGAMAYQAMAQFRTARYRASPGRYGLVQAPWGNAGYPSNYPGFPPGLC